MYISVLVQHVMRGDLLSGHHDVGGGLENRHTEAEDISRLAITPLENLGREVEFVTLALESIVDERVLRRRRTWPDGCHAKVADFEAARVRNEDVFGLDIQMNDSGRVNEVQALSTQAMSMENNTRYNAARTPLSSARIRHTRPSSSFGYARPYANKKCARLPSAHSSVCIYNVSSSSQLST